MIRASIAKARLLPKWQQYAYYFLAVFLIAYVVFTIWGARPPAPGVIITAKESPAIAKMPRK